jgi:hypothetical protein
MANNRTYEEHTPAVEWSRSAAEADAVKISLPGKQSLGSFPAWSDDGYCY